MFENLEVFRMAHAMARHAGTRQAAVARNIANADTPGYAARDVAPFSEVLRGAQDGHGGFGLRATRPGHIGHAAAGARPAAPRLRDAGARPAAARLRDLPADPNGNTVSLETEMLRAVEIGRQHNRAVTIYKSSLDILRNAVRRR